MAHRRQLIFVMGVTGVGKSTFIQTATGHEVKVGHTLDPCTTEVKAYQIPGTNVYLIDTPGFDDPNVSDPEILENISNCLQDGFNDGADIMGALYIHPITEARMKMSGMTNLRLFKKVVGMDKMSKVRLVLTKCSLEPKDRFEANERQLATETKYWKPLLDKGALIVRFGDSWQSAMDILSPLVQGQPFVPLLTQQVVFDHLTVPDTDAGAVVTDNVDVAIRAGEDNLKDLDKEWKDAVEKKEDAWAAELKAEKEKVKEEQKKREADRATLVAQREAGPRSNKGRIGRWIARAGAVLIGGVTSVVTFGAATPAAIALYGAVETGAQAHKYLIES